MGLQVVAVQHCPSHALCPSLTPTLPSFPELQGEKPTAGASETSQEMGFSDPSREKFPNRVSDHLLFTRPSSRSTLALHPASHF